jgi:hypothetical protein
MVVPHDLHQTHEALIQYGDVVHDL